MNKIFLALLFGCILSVNNQALAECRGGCGCNQPNCGTSGSCTNCPNCVNGSCGGGATSHEQGIAQSGGCRCGQAGCDANGGGCSCANCPTDVESGTRSPLSETRGGYPRYMPVEVPQLQYQRYAYDLTCSSGHHLTMILSNLGYQSGGTQQFGLTFADPQQDSPILFQFHPATTAVLKLNQMRTALLGTHQQGGKDYYITTDRYGRPNVSVKLANYKQGIQCTGNPMVSFNTMNGMPLQALPH